MKTALISFVGINDTGKLKDKSKDDGAILTIFKERKFDSVYLLYNPTKENEKNFYNIAFYVKEELIKRKYGKEENIELHSFECTNVTDHNEIYPKLLKFCESLPRGKNYTAAIASGTPAMQVCWILIAESGDFPLNLIRSNEPRFGKPYVNEVKLGTGLPRIKKLQTEIEYWTGEYIKTLPKLLFYIKKRIVVIGNSNLDLAPIEFVYFRYFIERAYEEKDFIEFTDSALMPEEFYHKILQYHRESFPAADSNRMALEKIKGISTAVFRSNINKLNNKIKTVLENEKQENYFLIQSEGKRFYKSYGIKIPKEKIKIIK